MNVQAVRPAVVAPARTLKQEVRDSALETGRQWAEESSTISAGAGGFSLMMLGLYGGVIGGALAGGILGGGFAGPVAAALSHGGWSFLSTGLHTVNAFGAAGMVLGGVCGVTGGWRVGSKLGELAGQTAFVPGAAVGAVNGAASHWLKSNGAALPARPAAAEPMREPRPYVSLGRGPLKNIGFIIGGMATLSGLAGGAAIGAGIASGAGLAQGLIASNLNFPTLVGAAATGALVGGVALGALCFVGGITLVDLIRKGVAEAKFRRGQGERWLELDKKEAALDSRTQQLDQTAREQQAQQARQDKDRGVRELMLKYRQDAVHAKSDQLTAQESKATGARADELYGQQRQGLERREGELDQRKAALDRTNTGHIPFPAS